MASVYHILCDATHTVSHIIEKDREFEEDRSRFHYAALQIQRHWRGYQARKEILRLHAAATIIQKWVRRYICQISMGNYMLNYLQNLANRLYYSMATKIQAWYRGNWYRNHVLNFHAMYMHRLKVNKINQEMRETMRQEKIKAVKLDRLNVEMEARQMILFILFKLHHTLRTDKEGIYSIHNSSKYSLIENLFKSIKFTDYMKALRKLYNTGYEAPQERKCFLKGRWRECEKAYYKRDKSHDVRPGPPINPNEYLHDKRFCFDPHVMRKDESDLLAQGKFVPKITDIMRTFNFDLNITYSDFDITNKMVPSKSKVPPYHINFWNKICDAHYFNEDEPNCMNNE